MWKEPTASQKATFPTAESLKTTEAPPTDPPRVEPAGHGEDNAIGATATAGDGPVEVRVLGRRRDEMSPVNGDDLPLECVVGAETVLAGQHGMAATLGVASSDADGRAGAANNLVAGSVRGGVSLEAFNASAEFDGRSLVVRSVVVGDVLGRLQVVRPQREPPCR